MISLICKVYFWLYCSWRHRRMTAPSRVLLNHSLYLLTVDNSLVSNSYWFGIDLLAWSAKPGSCRAWTYLRSVWDFCFHFASRDCWSSSDWVCLRHRLAEMRLQHWCWEERQQCFAMSASIEGCDDYRRKLPRTWARRAIEDWLASSC